MHWLYFHFVCREWIFLLTKGGSIGQSVRTWGMVVLNPCAWNISVLFIYYLTSTGGSDGTSLLPLQGRTVRWTHAWVAAPQGSARMAAPVSIFWWVGSSAIACLDTMKSPTAKWAPAASLATPSSPSRAYASASISPLLWRKYLAWGTGESWAESLKQKPCSIFS